MRNKLVFLILLLGFIGIGSSLSYGEGDRKVRWGLSILGGPNADFIHDRPTLTLIALLPRIEIPLHPRWDFEMEGNLSYYWIKHDKNLYLLGLNSNFLFKSYQKEDRNWFFLGGMGWGYINSNKELRYIGDSHWAGVLQGGTGVQFLLRRGIHFRGEYRLQHISDPFNRDKGINTHSFLLGLSF